MFICEIAGIVCWPSTKIRVKRNEESLVDRNKV